MKLKILLFVTFFLTSCTHFVIRKNYNPTQEIEKKCEATYVKDAKIDTSEYTYLGLLKLKDTGFSMQCNEYDALALIKTEACSLGADIVNISDEERPSISSICYRVEAEFYRQKKIGLLDTTEVLGDYKHPIDSVSVEKRVKEDRNRMKIIKSIEYGIIPILMTFLLINLLR